MQANTRLLLPVSLLAVLLLFAGCATAPTPRDGEFQQALESAAAFLPDDPTAAAEAFESLARASRGDARAVAYLRAAEAWLLARDLDRATSALERAQPLPDDDLIKERALLVHAEFDLIENNPRQALLRLDLFRGMNVALRDRATQLRGRALFQLGAIVDATLLLDHHLQASRDPEQQLAYSRLIWRGLSRAREPITTDNLPQDVPNSVRGWLELGRVGQNAWQNPYEFPARLDAWARRYSSHPARRVLFEEILAEHERRFGYPERIALLLPMSGRHAASAEAVRDGFLAALYQHASHRTAPEVRLYDTAGEPERAVEAARRAMREGAGIIVGPLTKEALGALNRADDINVPVLGLNYLESSEMAYARAGLVQFGLLPEDEAIQVAERSFAEGFTRAAALVPENDFGLRLLAAFRNRFEELGGELLVVQRYRPGQADYSTPIMRTLGLDESRLRYQQLRGITGQSMEFEPRRRQDIEFLFLGANFDEARLIRPQLRFHHAISLPVYSTSHVYRPGQTDRDLDGIRFADMPWILAPDLIGKDVRDSIANLWPGRFERSGRLYALGFDAFRLAPLVMNNDPALQNPLPAMSGLLSLDQFGRIRRDLYWARFASGVPRLLPAVEEPAHDAQGEVREESDDG